MESEEELERERERGGRCVEETGVLHVGYEMCGMVLGDAGCEVGVGEGAHHPLWRNSEEGRLMRVRLDGGDARVVDSVPLPMRGVARACRRLRKRGADGSRGGGDKVEESDYDEGGVGIMSEISKEEWGAYWRHKGWRKSGGRSGQRVAHMKAAVEAGSGMVELGRRMCNCVVRSGVTPPMWEWEVVCPIPKVAGCADIDKMRPIKLLEVLKKAVSGIVKERHMRGLRKLGVMRGAQYAYQRRLGTEVPLCIMNMVSEWAVMHRRELWDQGHDLSHAFDMPEYVMGKEVALRRTGVGERYIALIHAMEEGARMSVMTAWGLSDEVAGERGVEVGCDEGCTVCIPEEVGH